MTPAFQFYPADWLSNARVAMATLEEEGAYIRLLCFAWREGFIPSDPKRCASLIGKGATEDLARVVQGWFNQHPTDSTKMVHSRLEREREKQDRWREKSAEGGKKSAEIRKNNRVKTRNSRVVQPPYEPNGNSSSSSSSTVPPKPPDAPASPTLGNGESKSPKSPEALSVAALFSRRAETEWDEKEISKFKKLFKRGVMTLENMDTLSAYYAAERARNGDGKHRRDLSTFLNNFDGELDRAVAFKANPKTNGTHQPGDSARNCGHNAGVADSYANRPKRSPQGESPATGS